MLRPSPSARHPPPIDAASSFLRKGRFSLSTRSLLELQPYLKSTYPEEVLDCTICFEVGVRIFFPQVGSLSADDDQILTRGYACPRANCKVQMHNPCYDAYRRSNSNSKCTSCQEDWGRVGNDKVVPIGEAAAPKDEWPRRTRRSLTESEDEQDDTNVPMADPAADAESSRAPAIRRNPQRATSAR